MAAPPPPSYQQATNQGGFPNNYPTQGLQYSNINAPCPPPVQTEQQVAAPYPNQAQGTTPYPTFSEQQAVSAPIRPPPPPARTSIQETGDIDDSYRDYNDTGEILGDGWAGASFSDKAIRRTFIRKVYLILTAQLLVTVIFICFFMFHTTTREWIQGDGFWFYYLSYATFLVTYITLVCCPSVRRKWPGNFICLAVFTLAFSYMTGTITSFYDTKVVLIAAGITTLVTFSISLFAIQTKIDFTLCGGLLFAGCMVVFLFGMACTFTFIFWGPNYILQCVYGALAALLFSLFLAYDTQMLMGGRKISLSPEEHIYGALQLYLDVIYIFLIILSFFGGKK